jgi:hypothetical protein
MKMFTPVLAGVRGIATEICVAHSEFVEFGQTLFPVKPQSSALPRLDGSLLLIAAKGRTARQKCANSC